MSGSPFSPSSPASETNVSNKSNVKKDDEEFDFSPLVTGTINTLVLFPIKCFIVTSVY